MARHKINNGRQQHPQATAQVGAVDPLAAPNGPGVSTIVDRSGPGELVRASVRGGSIGIIPEAERRVSLHNLVSTGGLDRKPEGRVVQTQNFTLVDGPRSPDGKVTFMYGGCRTYVSVGKVFSPAHYDMDLLRRQGLAFREEAPPAPDPEPELEELAPDDLEQGAAHASPA